MRERAEIRSLITMWVKTMEQSFKGQSLVIRKASVMDASAILILWQDAAKWLQAKGIDQWNPEGFTLERVIKYMNNGSDIYLAQLIDEYVGTFTITWKDPFIWGELDNSESGYIHKLAVDRKFKGLGIGHKLLRLAEDEIRKKGKKFIRLDCMADNIKLNQYYRDYGYQYIDRTDGEGWSANLYEKH